MPAESEKHRPGARPGAETDPSAEGGPEDLGSTRGLLGVTVRRPVGVFMVLMAVALFGYTSLERLPLNLLPDLSFPTLTVRTTWEGAAPEEIETRITRPLEESLRMVPGLVESTSTSRADLSSIRLRFAWGTDMRFASQDVAERVQQSRNELPRDVEQPLILRYDPTLEPVLRLAVRTKVSGELPELRRYAEDELSRALEKVEGVAAAKVKGGLEEEIHIDLDEDLLAGQGLTVGDVSRRLGEENIDVAAGSLLDGDTEYLVRTQNQLRTLDEVRELVLARRGNAVIRLRDVGKVERSARERDVMLRVDGTEGVMVEIHREAGQNLVEVARRVRERMFGTDAQKAYVKQHQERLDRERLKETRAIAQAIPDKKKSEGAGKRKGKRGRGGRRGRGAFRGMSGGGGGGPMDAAGRQRRLDREMTSYLAYATPETFEAVLLEDSSVFVESAIDEVNQAVLLGGLLSILMLFLFLRRFRPTLIIAVSLPASVLLTFAGLFLFDISLNLMSLGGLALGIGMLVDNSIVVLESIVRCREEGDELVRAVLRGTREVGGAVFASTLTTVAVFLPIVFVEGIAGQIFGDQAITVVLSLVASLAAALFLIPMLQSRTFQSGKDTDLGRPWTFPSTRERWSTVRRGPWLLKPLALAVLPLVFVLELIGLILFTVIVIVIGRGGGLLLRGGGKLLSIVLLPITWPFDKGYDALEALYRPVLRVALRRRALTLLVALGVVVYAVLLYPRLGAELLPRIRQGRVAVEITLPATTPVERTDAVLAGV
ncbi:MAG: efflux RND transporter permease subunit, partial [Planctomycetota bacterium]